jgi:ribosomal-protein-alanine N-acetyltransferase
MGMQLRGLVAADRPAVAEALVASAAFSGDEVQVALEMIDAGLGGDYLLPAVEADGAVRAYACIGHATLTASSWYVYWICVHPAWQGRGFGRALNAHIEELVRAAGGERLVVETSGRADYTRPRRFYEASGYERVGRIADFYTAGDDCLIYSKVLR